METTENSAGGSLLDKFHAWNLRDAKSRLSELVRQAKTQPQRVTVDGKDAVMVVSVDMFASMLPPSEQPNLHELLQNSPLARDGFDFDFRGEEAPVRDVEL